MKKWEYKTRQVGIRLSIDNVLNELGKEGWELVAVGPHSTAFFKRELK